jgi:hypothetical protein
MSRQRTSHCLFNHLRTVENTKWYKITRDGRQYWQRYCLDCIDARNVDALRDRITVDWKRIKGVARRYPIHSIDRPRLTFRPLERSRKKYYMRVRDRITACAA